MRSYEAVEYKEMDHQCSECGTELDHTNGYKETDENGNIRYICDGCGARLKN